MPRSVDLTTETAPVDTPLDGAAVTAARLVAFAITALLISFLVIDRSGGALNASARTPAAEIATGSVSLTDDDDGRTLFDLNALLPGRPVKNCIHVAYAGAVFDGTVGLAAGGGGPLAPFLDVEIRAGHGGGYGNCGGFRSESSLYQGTLADLVRDHGPHGDPLPAIPIDEAREDRTFEVTFALRPDGIAQDQKASVDFRWSVSA